MTALALTRPMQRVLKTAMYRSTEACWQVAREGSGAHGRIVRALKDRHLITATSVGWILTRRGERERSTLVGSDADTETFIGGGWR